MPDRSKRPAGRNPLLCPPEKKAELEAENGANQLELVEDFVSRRGASELTAERIRELHGAAVHGIFPCKGQYRRANQLVRTDTGFEPVSAGSVPALVGDIFAWLKDHEGPRIVYRAAYVLWRICWIHPFAGGNGRTARAAAYFQLALDLGFLLPGPSIHVYIKENRDRYIEALRVADESVGGDPWHEPDLGKLEMLLAPPVMEGLATYIESAESVTPWQIQVGPPELFEDGDT